MALLSMGFHRTPKNFLRYFPQPRTLTTAENTATDSPLNKYTLRTHTCGQLTKEDIGKRVSLSGWVQYTRFRNKFLVLRDSYGITQCVAQQDQKDLKLANESVVRVEGIVRARLSGQENSNMSTGEVELLIDNLEVMSHAKKDLPILARDDPKSGSTTLMNRLKYRYLDLRTRTMQHSLRFRSQVYKILRDKLHELNFVECETPTLFNRTPGGANEFIVPTQLPNKFYNLTQSPQQLKQLLMIGGLDRYFQICRCYRDESGRTDRQLEFTQLDIELSFTNQDLTMRLVEELIYDLLLNICDEPYTRSILTSSFDDNQRIERICYKDAILKYGTDKPDTRFNCLIERDKDGCLYLEFPYIIEQAPMADIMEETRRKTKIEHNIPIDIVHAAGKTKLRTLIATNESRALLGELRSMTANWLEKEGKSLFNSKFAFLWVTEFPLFEADEEGNLHPNHHPFTAPTSDSVHLLEVDPLEVIGQHYDLVLNGQEVAGGSIRIHDAELQRKIFTELLKVEAETFDYFLEALESGCPPHGGIAFGIDRLIAILLDRESIRDVIAFPKTNTGRELMTGCPRELPPSVKKCYHL